MSRDPLGLKTALNDYLDAHVEEHPVLAELRAKTAPMEWGMMQISPSQGAYLSWLVQLVGARRAIEVGVFTGYSSLVTALALPEDGYLLACDVNPEWTAIAEDAWAKAGVADKIQLVIQQASVTLEERIRLGESNQYDFAFIDADKVGYLDYFEKCVRLVRSGGVVVLDNMLWGGSVADRGNQKESTRAIRETTRRVFEDRRVDASLIPVGDGLLLARVK